jgi:hypothetical protein
LVSSIVSRNGKALFVALRAAIHVFIESPGIGADGIVWHTWKHPGEGGVLIGPTPEEHQANIAGRRIKVLTRLDCENAFIEVRLTHRD